MDDENTSTMELVRELIEASRGAGVSSAEGLAYQDEDERAVNHLRERLVLRITTAQEAVNALDQLLRFVNVTEPYTSLGSTRTYQNALVALRNALNAVEEG